MDKLGFVNEGKYLCLIIPAREEIAIFQVRQRRNKGSERINYGPLPITNGTDDGVLNGGTNQQWKIRAYRSTPGDRIAGLENIDPNYVDDIFWYTDTSQQFHVILDIKPEFLRNIVYYPEDQPQSWLRGQPAQYNSDFGVFYGRYEYIVLPKIHVEFNTYNETNLNVRTWLTIWYANYKIKNVENENKARDILRRKQAKILTLPYQAKHETVETALNNYKMFSIDLLEEVV